ncbi:MAG: PPC domain-containing protein [Bryobacteraceae bacterium]
MRLVVAALLGAFAVSVVHGQTCAPVRILPSATVSASLDNSSCVLSDGTAYQAYRLVLPDRGQIQINLSGISNNLILILRDNSGAQIASGLAVQQPIEAGSYTLLVDGQTPGQVGGYTVQTAFMPEPGMLCANFDSIGLHDTVDGTLGMSGCALPSGTAYEGYSLSTLGSGTLTISVSSPDFTPAVIVRQPDGTAVASGGALQVAVYAHTQYEILISTADVLGAYEIDTSFQPAATETCVPQSTFSASASDNSTVTTSSCTSAGDNGTISYFTFYNLTLTAAGLADLSAASSAFDPTIYLLDQSGNTIALDTGGGGSTAAQNIAEIRAQLSPGNYTVEIVSPVATGGAYAFNYQFTAGSPQPCSLIAASPSGALAGTLTPSSCRDNDLGLTDLYSVTLPADGTLDATLTSSAFAGRLAFRDTKDNLILLSEDDLGLGSTELVTQLPAGTYTVAAAAISGTGAYQLTANFTAHTLTPCTYIQPVDNNGGYIADLGEGSCPGPSGQPLDLYQFTLPSAGVILAVMTSSQVEGHLTLTDQSGNLLRSDEDSYAPNDPLIIQYLPAGTYQLQARAVSVTAGGLYEVDVRTTAGSRPPFCVPQGGLTVGATINGALNYTSCQYTDSTFADVYSFTLNAATTVNLELDSSAFSAYLILLDSNGNLLAFGDSGGGGASALLQQTLPAGTYYVVAKAEPYSGYYNSVGAYTLSLTSGQ